MLSILSHILLGDGMENHLYNSSYQQYYDTKCCTEFRNLETKGPEEVPIPVVELNILLLFSVEGQLLSYLFSS